MKRYKVTSLTPEFVQTMPSTLKEGVLYVSMEYGTVVHRCCCGCGRKVVTPLSPTDWNIWYDGESVTLRPSIGSWSLPCKSHYLITRGKIVSAPRWTQTEIDAGRQEDDAAKQAYFGHKQMEESTSARPQSVDQKAGLLRTIRERLGF